MALPIGWRGRRVLLPCRRQLEDSPVVRRECGTGQIVSLRGNLRSSPFSTIPNAVHSGFHSQKNTCSTANPGTCLGLARAITALKFQVQFRHSKRLIIHQYSSHLQLAENNSSQQFSSFEPRKPRSCRWEFVLCECCRTGPWGFLDGAVPTTETLRHAPPQQCSRALHL